MSSGLLVDLHLMHNMRRSQDNGFLQAIWCCKVVLTDVSGVVITQIGSGFQLCKESARLSIVARCHVENLSELET